MLLYLPKITTGPAFLGLNFQGNQRVEVDPKGKFLALQQAEVIYRLYQKNPFGGVTEAPPPGKRAGHLMGCHLRDCPHEIPPEDRGHYLDFAHNSG
jgi:hypothetical protein